MKFVDKSSKVSRDFQNNPDSLGEISKLLHFSEGVVYTKQFHRHHHHHHHHH